MNCSIWPDTSTCNPQRFLQNRCQITQLHVLYVSFCACELHTLSALMSLQVTVGNDNLTEVVQVANSKASDKPLKFTTALHTYFRVADISQTQVEGFSGLKYLDNMQNRQQVKFFSSRYRDSSQIRLFQIILCWNACNCANHTSSAAQGMSPCCSCWYKAD